jgi:hypothetical protein
MKCQKNCGLCGQGCDMMIHRKLLLPTTTQPQELVTVILEQLYPSLRGIYEICDNSDCGDLMLMAE